MTLTLGLFVPVALLIGGITYSETTTKAIPTKAIPNQGIWRSAQNALRVYWIIFLILILVHPLIILVQDTLKGISLNITIDVIIGFLLKSLKILVISVIIGCLVSIIATWERIKLRTVTFINFWFSSSLFISIAISLLFGYSPIYYPIGGAILVSLTNGGFTCIQHFMLRIILYCEGYIPWDYIHFLDFATERIFLLNDGNGYKFRHRVLQDYFTMRAERDHIIDLTPDDYALLIAQQGETYQQMGQHNVALANFNRAIELDPESTWIFALRAETYRQMGQYDKALIDLNHAIKPDAGITVKSILEHKIGSYGLGQRLLAYFTGLINLNPINELKKDNASLIVNRGEIYMALKHYDDALLDYKHASQLEPNNPYFHNNLGSNYLDLKQFDKAKVEYKKRIKMRPEDSLCAYVSLAVIAYHQGNSNEAERYCTQALAIWETAWERQLETPFSLLQRKAVALLILGQSNVALQTMREAIAHLQQQEIVEFAYHDLLSTAPQTPQALQEFMELFKSEASSK